MLSDPASVPPEVPEEHARTLPRGPHRPGQCRRGSPGRGGPLRVPGAPVGAGRSHRRLPVWPPTARIAPNHAAGHAQNLLGPPLAAHLALGVATKAVHRRGSRERRCPHRRPVPLRAEPRPGAWALADPRTRERLGHDRLDLISIHNPERVHPGDRPAPHCAIRDASAVMEEAVAAGHPAAVPITGTRFLLIISG